jgi:NAD+ synthase
MNMEKKRSIIEAIYERDAIVDWIRQYFVNNGNENTKAVIGISGGKDSTIAAALLVRAIGANRVVGVLMPQDNQKDIDDSHRVCDILGIQKYVINIGPVCDELFGDFMANTGFTLNPQIATNAPARIRMNILYMVAAAVGGRVCNTGNASELYVGYTTKYGDLAGDFSLFRKYYVREVLAIGATMDELPRELVFKAPGDGMCGKTDEDNLGFTYETLDDYCIDNIIPCYNVLRNIEQRHKVNQHKQVISLLSPTPRSRHFEGEKWERGDDYRF